MRRFAPQLFAQVFCISLFLLSPANSQAQKVQPASPQERVRNQQWTVENLRAQTPSQPFGKTREQVEADVRRDFRQLQIVNNDLMQRVFDRSSTQTITNKEIRSSLGEIKKLAERLRYNFGIPKMKATAESELALIPGLRQLDKAVSSFVENPLFQQLRVFDAEMASKAGDDLSEVLRLTDVLRRLTKDD